jgi:hypothetical protein
MDSIHPGIIHTIPTLRLYMNCTAYIDFSLENTPPIMGTTATLQVMEVMIGEHQVFDLF